MSYFKLNRHQENGIYYFNRQKTASDNFIYDFVFLSARRRRISKNACRFGWSKWVDIVSLELLPLNKMSRFLISSVHTQAVTAKMFKEGMRIEAIHVKKWVNLVGFYFYIAFTSKSSFSRELMGEKSTKHHDFLIEWRLQSQQRQNELVRTQKKQTHWSAERRNRPSDTWVSSLLID